MKFRRKFSSRRRSRRSRGSRHYRSSTVRVTRGGIRL